MATAMVILKAIPVVLITVIAIGIVIVVGIESNDHSNDTINIQQWKDS